MTDKVKPWVTGLRRELRVAFPVNKVNCLVSETQETAGDTWKEVRAPSRWHARALSPAC